MPANRLRTPLVNLALLACALLVMALALEAGLRLFPSLLPAGNYGHGRFSPELQMNVLSGRVVYNKSRYLAHIPNRDGFLDTEHVEVKPAGTMRIGFFGDSYTEAMQVPLQSRFFRRLPASLAGHPLEPLAFGIGGWGTLHSLLNYRVQAPRYDLDMAVYVFVENDLGDNDFRLQAALGGSGSDKPYAQLSDLAPGFTLEWVSRPGARPLWYRAAKTIQARSLLAQVLQSRLRLLRLQRATSRQDAVGGADMAASARGMPHSSDLPSSWPAEDTARAQELGRRILSAWVSEASREGRAFVILYVPRSEAMLRGDYSLEDTWRPWLGHTTADLGIPLMDPSPELRNAMQRGVQVYDDHWTEAGHQVVADFLARALPGQLQAAAP